MTLGRIWPSAPATQRPKKFLVNVTVERSLGPIHVLMSPENTAADLIGKVVEAYGKEGRRPLLLVTDPKGFELHYSQYSLDSTPSPPPHSFQISRFSLFASSFGFRINGFDLFGRQNESSFKIVLLQ
ncbi:hypothetical protein AXF42_Ash009650 [Apostasia shenzhenica]|uniref:DUF7054 domain-containing protein n=1 Tax=Apostasia shenzhenica TaxID=1088818 RepID=A0A2I0AWS2_9ASPA|nr:hypothetical protein AXF42_Ash009650 [Apostasia shenzhenica]